MTVDGSTSLLLQTQPPVRGDESRMEVLRPFGDGMDRAIAAVGAWPHCTRRVSYRLQLCRSRRFGSGRVGDGRAAASA